MLNIDIDPEAETFILTLPLKRQKQVVDKIDALAAGYKSGTKSLKEFPSLFRMRSGDYRIVYYIESNTLNIILIDLRSRIYKGSNPRPLDRGLEPLLAPRLGNAQACGLGTSLALRR